MSWDYGCQCLNNKNGIISAIKKDWRALTQLEEKKFSHSIKNTKIKMKTKHYDYQNIIQRYVVSMIYQKHTNLIFECNLLALESSANKYAKALAKTLTY